jgi:hypothetical protein
MNHVCATVATAFVRRTLNIQNAMLRAVFVTVHLVAHSGRRTQAFFCQNSFPLPPG